MFRIATVLDVDGTVVVHGENVSRTITVVDQSVRLEVGKRVVISDLGEGNNQWAIVRSLGTGTPPAPPQGIELVANLADLVGNLLASGSLTMGWARTVKYSLDHYADIIGDNGGTAYATLYRPPRDYRLMLPIDLSEGDTPGEPFGFTLVNRVDGPGRTQIPPAQVVGPGNTIQNPANPSFDYGPMPVGSEVVVGGEVVGYWFDERARLAGLPGGAIVGPDAQMSQTVASVFLGPSLAEGNSIPLFPAAVGPEQVFSENANPAADVERVENRLNENLGRRFPREDIAAIFIGASFTFPDVGINYIDAQDRLFELLRS